MDSPKCRECRDRGIEAQTYKIAGKPHFRCQKCGMTYHREMFNESDFNWKNK